MNILPAVCPRCEGTMLKARRDAFGEFRECLSCGHYIDRLVGPPIPTQPRRCILPVASSTGRRRQNG